MVSVAAGFSLGFWYICFLSTWFVPALIPRDERSFLIFRLWCGCSQFLCEGLDSGLLVITVCNVQVLVWVSAMIVKHAANGIARPVAGSEFAQSELICANGVP